MIYTTYPMPDKLKRYITIDPAIKGGTPVISGTRVSVAEIIDLLKGQHFVDEIIGNLKQEGVIVTNEEIFAALEYAKYSSLDEAKTPKRSK